MAVFETTRWSLILAARGEPGDALDALCRIYRPAVLAYVRGFGYSRSDAEDLTQGFFARFLEKQLHAVADPARGRFRVFLRSALRNYVINAHGYETAARRHADTAADVDPEALAGEPGEDLPERAFERAWSAVVVNRALERLRHEVHAAGKAELFARLRGFLLEAPEAADYARIGGELGMRPNTVAVATHRLRQRLRALVREELADTVADVGEIESEYSAVIGSMGEGRAGEQTR